MAKEPVFTRDFMALFIARVTSSMVFTLTGATMATYALEYYGVDLSLAGVVVGAYVLGSLVSRVFSGMLIARYGYRASTRFFCIWFIVGALLYFVPTPLPLFVIVRFLHGVAFGVLGITLNVMGARIIPKSRYGEGMGMFALSGTLAGALGPFVGISILMASGFTAMFCANVALTVICLICSLVARVPDDPAQTEAHRRGRMGLRFSDMVDAAALPLSVLVLLLNFSYVSVTSLIKTYAETVGIDAWVPWAFVVYLVVAVAFRPVAGRLMDSRGDNWGVYPMLASFALALVVIAWLYAPWQLFAMMTLMAMGYGCAFSAFQTIVLRESREDRLAHATSTYYMFADAGMGLGPMVMGAVAAAIGFTNMYLVASANVALIIVWYRLIHGHKHMRNEAVLHG